VPITVSGEIKIAAVSDLGGLGEKQGEPLIYIWTPPSMLSAFPPLIPWLIVIISILMALKKDRRAVGILIPLIVSILILFIINQFLPNEIQDAAFKILVSLVLAQAAIWLILERFAGINRFRVFIQTVFIMLIFGFLFLITYDAQQRGEKIGFMILYGISTLTIHLSIILSRFLVRRRFTPLRFTILIPFLNIITVLPMFFIAVVIIIMASNANANPGLFLMGLIVSSVLGLILFIVALPFLILVFKNGYFRETFYRIFRLQAVSPPDFHDRFKDL
jgi:hypothetical protein